MWSRRHGWPVMVKSVEGPDQHKSEVQCVKQTVLFNRRPPRGETAAPFLFSAILSKRLSENGVPSKRSQCERQLCLGFVRRVVGGFSDGSRQNLGRFGNATTCTNRRPEEVIKKPYKTEEKAAGQRTVTINDFCWLILVPFLEAFGAFGKPKYPPGLRKTV